MIQCPPQHLRESQTLSGQMTAVGSAAEPSESTASFAADPAAAAAGSEAAASASTSAVATEPAAAAAAAEPAALAALAAAAAAAAEPAAAALASAPAGGRHVYTSHNVTRTGKDRWVWEHRRREVHKI